MKQVMLAVCIMIMLLGMIFPCHAQIADHDRIQPYAINPQYWQYKGQPVFLAGGSKTDHLFLIDGLQEHLDEMVEVGANYIRNTMSQRDRKELKPHKLLPDGTFDMDQWNDEYWQRFENMLQWTAERDIFVQIEVWDRFDYATNHWDISPWNPNNNVNYTAEESGFAEKYISTDLYRDKHPFFYTVPESPNYQKRLDMIRAHQERFVDKMLSYSLSYGHVLYCMNNETSSPPEWGRYWIQSIQKKAAENGVIVYTTDMFDDLYMGDKSEHFQLMLDQPDLYTFIDISQVNSRNFDEKHWNQMRWLVERIGKSARLRPANNTKIYGGGYSLWGSGGPDDGIQRFWRDVLGGCASVRHHRPSSGNGLEPIAKACIRSFRMVESLVKMWDVEPHMELLLNRDSNEAYLAANPGEVYVLYLPRGGAVGVDLSACKGTLDVQWINAGAGETWKKRVVEGGAVRSFKTPMISQWIAIITPQE
jgi:hypothetical protein